MIQAAVGYVASAKHGLPNLMAARITRSFDDRAPVVSDQGASDQRLHAAGTFTQEITYREGHEVINQSSAIPGRKTRRSEAPHGLSSWGEFGPLLATILADAAKGQLTWYRWEQTPAGMAAVFQYKVPPGASHYVVNYCCVRGLDGPDLDRPWNNAEGDSDNSYTGRRVITETFI